MWTCASAPRRGFHAGVLQHGVRQARSLDLDGAHGRVQLGDLVGRERDVGRTDVVEHVRHLRGAGEPTGNQVNLWGITQWAIEDGVVHKEWMMFNEFGVLMQISR